MHYEDTNYVAFFVEEDSTLEIELLTHQESVLVHVEINGQSRKMDKCEDAETASPFYRGTRRRQSTDPRVVGQMRQTRRRRVGRVGVGIEGTNASLASRGGISRGLVGAIDICIIRNGSVI